MVSVPENVPSDRRQLKVLEKLLDEEHIDSNLDVVVPALLNLSSHKVCGESVELREVSIRIIRDILTSPKANFVRRYQRQVVKGLLPALDDPKKRIRRLAAGCRNDWFLH